MPDPKLFAREGDPSHWTGDSIICTATGTNTLLWVSLFGEVRHVWKASGE